MRNARKVVLFAILFLASFIVAPNFVHADTKTAQNETQLLSAIDEATEGQVINLSSNIVLTKPIEINNGKVITINGNGNTITRAAEGYQPVGSNSTLLTAGGKGTMLHLMNVKLIGSEKYGVQAYNEGYVSLDGVTISDCAYGGVLVNAGTVEVKNLVLNRNGDPAKGNNGIEIAKSSSLQNPDATPVLVMNGSLTSSETENVIFLAVNDSLTEFEVKNEEGTQDKLFISGNKVIVTDANNNVKFVSNENAKEGLDLVGSDYVPNVTITIQLMDKTVTFDVVQGSQVSYQQLEEHINFSALGLENYTLIGFFTDEEFTEEFDFSQNIGEDTTIYAKISEKAKPQLDAMPKTGFDNKLGLAIFVIAISSLALVCLKRK